MGSTARRVLVLALAALTVMAALPSLTVAEAQSAMLRVVHASPDAPAVDVYLNDQRAIQNLRFSEATDYAMVPGGSYRVRVFPAGTGPGGTAVIDANVNLQGGGAYTVVAANTVARIEPLVIADNLARPAAGKAHIRVIHASPDAPNVDVAIAGGPVAFRNAPFKAATDYTPVDAGSYRFEVRPAGTTQAVLTTPALDLMPGGIYTAIALGQVGNNTLQVKALADLTPSGMPAAGGGGMSRGESGSLAWLMVAGALALAAATGLRLASAKATARK